MLREVLNKNTVMFVFLFLILVADYAAFFRICPNFLKQPSICAQTFGDHLGNGATIYLYKENNKRKASVWFPGSAYTADLSATNFCDPNETGPKI